MDYHILFWILPLIFIAGLVDSIAGGGGLISLPAYLLAGLPPDIALANNKMSSTFGTLYTTIRYFRHGMIDIWVAFPCAVCALIGSFLGAKIVLFINPDFLNYLLIILLPMIFIYYVLKKDFGEINTTSTVPILHKYLYSVGIGLALGFYDGFFGPGTGSFLILLFVVVLKYDLKIANGNTKVVNLASNVAALTIFILNGKVWFWVGIPAVFAGVAGNHIGSSLVIRQGNKVIKVLFIVVVLILLVKIVYDVIS